MAIVKHSALVVPVWLFAALLSAAEPPPDFNRDVAPILRKYCTACHGTDEPEKGLVLESYAGLVKGSERGAVIVPGKSDESKLVLLLDGRAKPAMPPKDNEAPSAAEIATLKRWIDAGAKAPSTAGPDPTILTTPHIKPRVAPKPSITAAAISPDGKLLALAGYQEVRLVRRESRTLVRRLTGIRGMVTAVSFSRDGSMVVTAAGEPGLVGEAALWRTADGSLVRRFVGHKDALYAAALSPDGKLLATGGYDQQARIWDATSGKELRTIVGHNGAIYDLAFHPQGKMILATASADRTVKLWDVATGARLETFGQPTKDQYSVAFSPDGRTVAAGGADNRIRVWRLSETAAEGTNPLVFTRYAHEGAVLKLAFSADGKLLATSGEDRTVRLWTTNDYVERESLAQQPDWAPALAMAADNQALLVGRLDGTFALYNPATGDPIAVPPPLLTSVEPRGVERGVATRIKIMGKNLLGAEQLVFAKAALARGSFQVKLVPPDINHPGELAVDITPATALARGSYTFTVATPGGKSGELSLYVDDLPQVSEVEPNNISDQAPVVKLPLVAWGTIGQRGDRDLLRFDAQAGQTLVFELAARSAGSTLNAVLTLLDPAGEVIASNNDFDGQNDPLVAYKIETSGRYTIRVQDQTLTGSPTHTYRLTAGPLSYVTGVFPLTVPAGKETSLELAGYNLPAGAAVKVRPEKAGETPVMLDGNHFRSGHAFKVLATSDNELVEQEPNDRPEQATALTTPASAGGRLWNRAGDGADLDLYRFASKKGESWVIETTAVGRGSPADTKVEVLDAGGRPVEQLLLQAVRDSYINFRPITSRDPDVRVQNWEEMELNQFIYLQGEVCKIFRMPQGPDSGFQFYAARGQRRAYFQTSATSHALDEPCYVVEPHPPGSKLIANGLPVFPLLYVNDDDAERELGTDSRLLFTAPADGSYLVRVSDVRGFGGDRFAYRLVVRPPRPGFKVSLAGSSLTVHAGSGTGFLVSADRGDGFDDDISIEVTGLPPGYSISTPLTIQAGHNDARAVLWSRPDAVEAPPMAWKQVRFVARAKIAGATVTEEVAGLQSVKLAPRPELLVKLEPAELTIAPGQRVTAKLKVERYGYKDRVPFDVFNLPHGVIVNNIGLNGILIPEGKSEREVFISAADWVPETDRPCYAETKNFRGATAGNQASPPLLLHVRAPHTVAQGAEK